MIEWEPSDIRRVQLDEALKEIGREQLHANLDDALSDAETAKVD